MTELQTWLHYDKTRHRLVGVPITGSDDTVTQVHLHNINSTSILCPLVNDNMGELSTYAP